MNKGNELSRRLIEQLVIKKEAFKLKIKEELVVDLCCEHTVDIDFAKKIIDYAIYYYGLGVKDCLKSLDIVKKETK